MLPGRMLRNCRLDAVPNKQWFLHVWTNASKELVNYSILRLATWSMAILSRKGMELVDTMIRSSINIACLQEISYKWVETEGEKFKETEVHGIDYGS